jgi:hypothetical protein
VWPNFCPLRIFSPKEQEETKDDVQKLIVKFNVKELGLTAVTSGNPCVESATVTNIQERSQRFCISLCLKMQWKCQNVQKVKSRNRCTVMQVVLNLNNFFDWWKTHEEELWWPSRIARQVLYVPANSASSDINFSVVGLVVQEC